MLGNRTKNFQLVPVHGALLYPLDFLMPPIKVIHLHNPISLRYNKLSFFQQSHYDLADNSYAGYFGKMSNTIRVYEMANQTCFGYCGWEREEIAGRERR